MIIALKTVFSEKTTVVGKKMSFKSAEFFYWQAAGLHFFARSDCEQFLADSRRSVAAGSCTV